MRQPELKVWSVICALLVSFCLGIGSVTPQEPGWRSLRLEGVDGDWSALDAFIGRGQWVVVNIWGPKCPPCVEELPELGSFHDTYVDGPAMVPGIAIDFPSFDYAKINAVWGFMESYLLDFRILMADYTVYRKLVDGKQLYAVPTSLLHAPDGALAAQHIGTLIQGTLERYLNEQDECFKVAPR